MDRSEGLKLEYPCPWTYTVFGSDEGRLREAVAGVVGTLPHSLVFSNSSATGKYCSLHLEMEVQTDEQRLRIFRELHEHADVQYVL